MMTTVDLVPDQLWNAIQPLLPPEPPKPKGGRPRVPDRAVLGGIVFMLRAASQAPSTTWSSTAMASRWRRGCRRPTPTTRSCWRPWWTRSRRSRARGAVPAGPANAPPSCTATKPTTPHAAGGHCAGGASCPGSPGAGSSPARSSAAIDGYSSGRWPGWAEDHCMSTSGQLAFAAPRRCTRHDHPRLSAVGRHRRQHPADHHVLARLQNRASQALLGGSEHAVRSGRTQLDVLSRWTR
jgi:transposase